MSNTINWGAGALNNTNGWGDSNNNTNYYGDVYLKSWSGETIIGVPFTQDTWETIQQSWELITDTWNQ